MVSGRTRTPLAVLPTCTGLYRLVISAQTTSSPRVSNPLCRVSSQRANNTGGNGTVTYSWFQHSFDVPSDWQGSSVVINFGAVDYEATVFVNGQNVTYHQGGYFRFWADITSAVKIGQSNEVVVFVHDPTDGYDYVIPVGKQTLNPSHIFYTPCTGIWQQVFIEPVPSDAFVEWIDLDADMYGQVNLTAHSSDGSTPNVKVEVWGEDGSVMATGNGQANSPVIFTVDNPKLWSPESPSLYNVTVTMGSDTMRAYTGFRTVSKGSVDGVTRPLLNGKFYFTFGTLDQGFWPDGLYTPPNYEAMTYDLQTLKKLGMNMVRKHIKVETDLFYYACDTMGLWVIQDMPALTISDDKKPNSTRTCSCHLRIMSLIPAQSRMSSMNNWYSS